MAAQHRLAGSCLLQAQTETGLDRHVAPGPVHRLPIGPLMVPLQQHPLAQQHRTIRVGAPVAGVAIGEVRSADYDPA
mgnify:CR=1 FL=1